jgi:hypothetical protein
MGTGMPGMATITTMMMGMGTGMGMVGLLGVQPTWRMSAGRIATG